MSKACKCWSKCCASCCKKTSVLIWKNWLLFYRCPILLFIIYGIPLLLTIVTMILLGVMGGTKSLTSAALPGLPAFAKKPTTTEPPNATIPETTTGPERLVRRDIFLLFSPVDNEHISKALRRFSDYGVNLIGFNDPMDAEEYYAFNSDKPILGILEFQDDTVENGAVPDNLNVIIRLPEPRNWNDYNDRDHFMYILREMSIDLGRTNNDHNLIDYSKKFARQAEPEEETSEPEEETSEPEEETEEETPEAPSETPLETPEIPDSQAPGAPAVPRGPGEPGEPGAPGLPAPPGAPAAPPRASGKAPGVATLAGKAKKDGAAEDVDKDRLELITNMLHFIFGVGLLPYYLLLVWFLASERICEIKELMYSMGVCRIHYWGSWFLLTHLMLDPVMIVMLVLLKIKIPPMENALLPKTDVFILLLLFIIIYTSSFFALASFMSVWCCDPCSTMLFGGVLYFLSFLSFFVRKLVLADSSLALIGQSVFVPFGLGNLLEGITEAELREEGVTFGTFTDMKVLLPALQILCMGIVFMAFALKIEYIETRWFHLPFLHRCCICCDPCVYCAVFYGRKLCFEKFYNKWCTCPKKKYCVR